MCCYLFWFLITQHGCFDFSFNSIYSLNCLHMWIKLFRSIFLLKFGYYWIATRGLIETVLLSSTAGAENFVLLVKIEFLFFVPYLVI